MINQQVSTYAVPAGSNPTMQESDSAPRAEDVVTPALEASPEATAALVLPHQQKAFEQLLDLTRVALFTQRQCFPVRLRTNSLIVGPTGGGKTYLATAVAKALNIPIFLISLSEWVLIGCSTRGASTTWPAIVDFLAKHKSAEGVIIAVDEIDKLSRNSSWEVFLLTEVFSLLDLRIPNNLRDQDEDEVIGSSTIESAREVLSTRTMLIGMGAFQDLWEAQQTTPIGFRQGSASAEITSLKKLAESIPPELANRFRSEVLILPPLTECHYHEMLQRCAEQVPANFRKRFLSMGKDAIPLAMRNRKGPRFLEELLVDLLIAERKAVRSPVGLEVTADQEMMV